MQVELACKSSLSASTFSLTGILHETKHLNLFFFVDFCVSIPLSWPRLPTLKVAWHSTCLYTDLMLSNR